MNEILRALIVDDEPPARRALERMLREVPAVKVVGSAANGLQALDALAAARADLLFLDIEMPVLAGMELAAHLYPAVTPAVIFVTAYPQYGARAFGVQAADYLLKPVDPLRLAQAVERARTQLRTRSGEQRIATLGAALHSLRAETHASDMQYVWVEVGAGRLRLGLEQIEWFAADGDYVQAHTAVRSYLMRDSLSRLEAMLPASRFVRVHRSSIVNLAAVTRVTRAANGQLLLTTRSGVELPVSRRSRARVRDILGT
jgi:two-component system LytT family response regulator